MIPLLFLTPSVKCEEKVLAFLCSTKLKNINKRLKKPVYVIGVNDAKETLM